MIFLFYKDVLLGLSVSIRTPTQRLLSSLCLIMLRSTEMVWVKYFDKWHSSDAN